MPRVQCLRLHSMLPSPLACLQAHAPLPAMARWRGHGRASVCAPPASGVGVPRSAACRLWLSHSSAARHGAPCVLCVHVRCVRCTAHAHSMRRPHVSLRILTAWHTPLRTRVSRIAATLDQRQVTPAASAQRRVLQHGGHSWRCHSPAAHGRRTHAPPAHREDEGAGSARKSIWRTYSRTQATHGQTRLARRTACAREPRPPVVRPLPAHPTRKTRKRRPPLLEKNLTPARNAETAAQPRKHQGKAQMVQPRLPHLQC